MVDRTLMRKRKMRAVRCTQRWQATGDRRKLKRAARLHRQADRMARQALNEQMNAATAGLARLGEAASLAGQQLKALHIAASARPFVFDGELF